MNGWFIAGVSGTLAAFMLTACARPDAVSDVADRSFSIVATMKADADIRRSLLDSQREALARETEGLEEATRRTKGDADAVIGDWRVEKREANLALVTGLRTADDILRDDPYASLRPISEAVPPVPPVDLGGLDKALAGLNVLRGDGRLSLGDYLLFGEDLLQAADFQRRDEEQAAVGDATGF